MSTAETASDSSLDGSSSPPSTNRLYQKAFVSISQAISTTRAATSRLFADNHARRRLEYAFPFFVLSLTALWYSIHTRQAMDTMLSAPEPPGLLELTAWSTLYGLALIESARVAHQASWNLRCPISFALAAVVVGPGIVGPLYLAGHYLRAVPARCGVVGSKRFVVQRVRPVLPLVVLLFVVIPWGLGIGGGIYAFVAPVMLDVLRWAYSKWKAEGRVDDEGESEQGEEELPAVRATVWGFVGVGGVAWIAWICTGFRHGSFERFNAEMMVLLAAGLYWNVLSILDLKRTRLSDDHGWLKLLGAGVLFFVVGGPGAVLASGWLFREDVLATYDDSIATLEPEDIEKIQYVRV